MLTATADDDSKHAAALVATSPAVDIALLRTARRPPAIARFSSAPQASNGNLLAVIGYPAYGLPTRLSSVTPLFDEGPRTALAAEALHERSRGFVVQIGCWN
jgi:hypothetical protein